jgi:hypothetical protein
VTKKQPSLPKEKELFPTNLKGRSLAAAKDISL